MKKRLEFFLLLIILAVMGNISVDAATNPYNQKERVPNNPTDKMTNCTWYAWQQAYDNVGVALPKLGNAKNWYSKAKSLGWHVGNEAKPNSIAVWNSSTYGHVGFVVSVDGSRMIVNEAGIYDIKREFDDQDNMISMKYVAYNGTGIYNGNWASTVIGGSRYGDEDSSGSKLIGFIYLDYVPPTTTTTSKKTTSKITTKVVTSNSTTKNNTTLSNTALNGDISKEDGNKEKDNIIEENGNNEEFNKEENNLKGILPYLILISLSLLLLLLILAKITKNIK